MVEINLEESFDYWKSVIGDLSGYPRVERGLKTFFYENYNFTGWINVGGGALWRYEQGFLATGASMPGSFHQDRIFRFYNDELLQHRQTGPAVFMRDHIGFCLYDYHLCIEEWLQKVDLTHDQKVMIKLKWG